MFYFPFSSHAVLPSSFSSIKPRPRSSASHLVAIPRSLVIHSRRIHGDSFFFSSHAIRRGGALLSFGGHLVSFLDLCMAAGCNENLISVDAAAAADVGVAQGDGCHHGGLS